MLEKPRAGTTVRGRTKERANVAADSLIPAAMLIAFGAHGVASGWWYIALLACWM
jgi:hypothetical protein